MDFEYILVSSCMVSNRDEQRLFEQSVINDMNPNLNQNRAYRTEDQKIEYQKEHYKENKEQIKEYQKEQYNKNKESIKEYQKENKEQIKEYQKEHYRENRKLLLEKAKIKIKCSYCDTHTNKSHIARHNRNKTHKKKLYLFYHNFIHS